MKRFLLLSFFICFLFSCAKPRPTLTRQEWLEMTSHIFKNTTVEKVLETGEKVLQLADPSDVKIAHYPNRMVGRRKTLFFMVISVLNIEYIFDLKATQKDNNVLATLYISFLDRSALIAPLMSGGAVTLPSANIGEPIDHKVIYELFFARMESLLYGTPWITCKEAKKIYSISIKCGDLEPLCFLADDNKPEHKK